MTSKRKANLKPDLKKGKPVQDDSGIRVDLQHRSFYSLSLLATQINRAIATAFIKSYGRPAHAWKIITVLGGFGPMSASEINSMTTLEMDKVTRIVDQLIEKGLVSRAPNPEDGRRVVIALSARGKRVNEQLERMIAEMERELLIILSRDERESLYALLDRLQERAEQVFNGKRAWSPTAPQG